MLTYVHAMPGTSETDKDGTDPMDLFSAAMLRFRPIRLTQNTTQQRQ
jgi:hypothetical protein